MKDMKKMKFFVLFAALVSMLGFTSCLDDNDDTNSYPGISVVRVEGFMGVYSLRLPSGATLEPTNQSDLTNLNSGDYLWVYYLYDPTTVSDTSNKVTVQLVTYIQIERTNASILAQAPTDADANMPVRGVSQEGVYVPMFYNRYDLCLPVFFYCKNVTADADLKAELNRHEFNLYYDAATDFGSDRITLHLRHKVTDLAENETQSMTNSRGTYKYFNIENAVSQYQAQNGGENPDKLVVEFEQNASNADYASKISATYEINYKEILASYN